MLLARIRQVAACGLLAVAAVHFFIYYLTTAIHGEARQWLEPAVLLWTAFYGIAYIGITLVLTVFVFQRRELS